MVGSPHPCMKALCQLSLKRKRMDFAVGQAGVWLTSDNYTVAVAVLPPDLPQEHRAVPCAGKDSCVSPAPTPFLTDNSPQANADWMWCNYYLEECLKHNSTTCLFSSPIRNRKGLNHFSQSIKNNRLKVHNASRRHCISSCKWQNIHLQRNYYQGVMHLE